MELQIKDDFKPNFGVGHLLFSDNENSIEQKLGTADFKNKDMDNDDYTIHISYKKNGIDCFVHYEDSSFSYNSFHLKDLLIDNIQIASLEKEDCILVLKKFHLKNSKEFVLDEKKILKKLLSILKI